MKGINKVLLCIVAICVCFVIVWLRSRAVAIAAPEIQIAGADQDPFYDYGYRNPRSPANVPEPAVGETTMTYPFKTLDFQNDARRLQEQYAGRAHIALDSRPRQAGVPYLIVRAPADVQAEIRVVIGFLTKQRPDPTGD